jgi:UDP-4-amino-4,6-dideoxy-N-acetyl-beta-L-altrosamine N-acetyltransferase
MISFEEIEIGDSELILSWRVSDRVSRFMNTDVKHDVEAQRKWIESCYDKTHYYHWIIKINNKPAGLINIFGFDEDKKTTSWGFYIGDESYAGYGLFIPPLLYNFLFQKLGIQDINVEVFYNNLNVIRLHKIHGYRFVPSQDRVIEKNGHEVLLIAMNLSLEQWKRSKRNYAQMAILPTSKWKARPRVLENL